LADVPTGGGKTVKEGAGAAGVTVNDTGYVYLLKGSGTDEFCCYNTLTNAWETKASAPYGASGKPFKHGSCLAGTRADRLYALKGSYNEFFGRNGDASRVSVSSGERLSSLLRRGQDSSLSFRLTEGTTDEQNDFLAAVSLPVTLGAGSHAGRVGGKWPVPLVTGLSSLLRLHQCVLGPNMQVSDDPPGVDFPNENT
jgi:hypothetical protein